MKASELIEIKKDLSEFSGGYCARRREEAEALRVRKSKILLSVMFCLLGAVSAFAVFTWGA